MHQHHRPIRTLQDHNVVSAWQEQIAGAAHDPALRQQCVQRERELFPRFAEQYEKLRALPRRVRRGLQRQWKHTLAGVALLMALGGGPATAAVFDVPCTAGVGDNAALIQAINDANNETTNPGPDTINLGTSCTHTLVGPENGADGGTGLPVITSEMTIDGNGSTITRPPMPPNFRMFNIAVGGNLTLQETTITRGDQFLGGGLLNRGTLALTECTVSGNLAGLYGGALDNNYGTATITNSTLSGNNANAKGGAVRNFGGTLVLKNSTISGNASFRGGGMQTRGASSTTLIRTLVSGNSATYGREIWRDFATGSFTVNNYNLFGRNNDAGVANVTLGARI